MNDKIIIEFSKSELSLNLLAFVLNDKAGAIVSFAGTVRDINMEKKVKYIEYNIFDTLAFSLLMRKCTELFSCNKIIKLCIFQRTGVVFVGDINLIVAVSSIDRGTAFSVCTDIVEYIKHFVPIWKKEYYIDSSYIWINSL